MKTWFNYILTTLFLTSLFACGSYTVKTEAFRRYLNNHEYEKAQRSLEHNKYLNRKRNELIYNLEMGKVSHLRNEYDTSNFYFNRADVLMDEYDNVGDYLTGIFLNPASQPFRASPVERFMIHYYKAINYIKLGKPESALVEARKIIGKNNEAKDRNRKYNADLLSLILQANIFEATGDFNNAFISYRNAYKVFEESEKQVYYGSPLPGQLKKDLLRSAYKTKFFDELDFYERKFSMKHQKDTAQAHLILFWENGIAPIKIQDELFFSLLRDGDDAYFTSRNGIFRIPYTGDADSDDLKKLGLLRVAYAQYESQAPYYQNAYVLKDSTTVYPLEIIQNINAIQIETHRDDMLKNLSQHLTRLAAKKLTEIAAREAAKDEDNGEIAGAVLSVINAATEKADTRSWQSLPGQIQYTRIPLNKGNNNLILKKMNKFNQEVSTNLSLEIQNQKTIFINVNDLEFDM